MTSSDRKSSRKMQWCLPNRRPFKTVENEWILLADGTRLAARLWLPEVSERVPVVLEYLPYRKRDWYRRNDDATGAKLASYGIAFARVDIRGSGESDGLLRGEYTRQEQSDALEVIAWLADQSWSNGSVGMRGISWGGFNSLQIAALNPPQLKAIMPCCFTDNQFTHDAHFYGGALSTANFYWGTLFQLVLCLPPDPAIVGERWREIWLKRLEGAPPILGEWTSHQRFDEHWKVGSVAVDYGRIRCPVYAVGGLNDHFVDVNLRIMRKLQVPRKCLIGPWAHNWPDAVDPGPGLEWVREEIRWWEHWLKGVRTGIMDEPAVRVYVSHKTAIETYPEDTPGEWVAEESWPSPRIKALALYLNHDGLGETPGEHRELSYRADRIVGTLRGEPDAFFFPADLPQEQTPDDGRSLIFDGQPLTRAVDIVGNPILKARLRVDVPIAKLAVRLNEVTPEGHSWMVSSGILNLTHRDSHEHPTPLQPGRIYDVELHLVFMSHRLRAGNKLRVALSENFWPLVWPSPTVATLTIVAGSTSLTLPVRPPKAEEEQPMDKQLRRHAADQGRLGQIEAVRARHAADGWITITKMFKPATDEAHEIGTHWERGWTPWTMQIREGDPNSCRWEGGSYAALRRGEWNVSVIGGFELRSTAGVFRLREFIRASEAEKLIFEREWQHNIPRDLM